MTISEREAAAALKRALVHRIGEPRYHLWFDGKTRFTWEDGRLTVGVPNLHFQEWLQATFRDALAAAAEEVWGRTTGVRFVIDPELFRTARQAQAALGPAAAPAAAAAVDHPEPAALPLPRPAARPARRWRRLEDFVVGPCNRVAHAAAMRVAEAPGDDANPLVLHGPTGTGKTHLLEGTCVALRRGATDVCFVTAEEFTNQFVQAVQQGKLPAFRRRFRAPVALLVDDLHFLAGKRATQEELLHTLDALQAEGRQVVVTCDCHPRLSDDFLPELADRLLGGGVWGLAHPDELTRLNILKARTSAAPLPDEVLRYVAEQVRGNVRELEGALHSVCHLARVAGRPADRELAREALGDRLRHSVRLVQLVDVEQAVCRVLRLNPKALQTKQRAWAVSHPRMLAMYLARRHTTAAFSEIGRHFGGLNHSTAVAAEKKVRRWLQDDGELAVEQRKMRAREVVELIERELQR